MNKEFKDLPYEEQEAIRAIMLEYINNCEEIVLAPDSPYGFYAFRKKE